jgi:hypothetical protein
MRNLKGSSLRILVFGGVLGALGVRSAAAGVAQGASRDLPEMTEEVAHKLEAELAALPAH